MVTTARTGRHAHARGRFRCTWSSRAWSPGAPDDVTWEVRPVVDGLVQPSWLISYLATVGGALGAGLESDDAVRQAAYGYRSDRAPTAG